MRLLVNTEISTAIENPAENNAALAYIVEDKPPRRTQVPTSQVQPTTLDLTIGEIFIPGSSERAAGGSRQGKATHTLSQGETAVIRTRERLNLGRHRAAIAFPPARTSLGGLLMTNPGHVDPGYEGPLHCTVINMGHESYPLRTGDRIMRVLFFELDQQPQAQPGRVVGQIDEQITAQLLTRLSVDFVDVNRRAKKIANAAVGKAAFISATVPVIVALITVFGANYFTPQQKVQDDIVALQKDLGTTSTKLEEKSDFYKLQNDLALLKSQVKDDDLGERLKALEARVEALSRAHTR